MDHLLLMHLPPPLSHFVFAMYSSFLQFLNRVKEIQEEQAAEEQARIEAELAKQKKLALKKRNESASSSDKKWSVPLPSLLSSVIHLLVIQKCI